MLSLCLLLLVFLRCFCSLLLTFIDHVLFLIHVKCFTVHHHQETPNMYAKCSHRIPAANQHFCDVYFQTHQNKTFLRLCLFYQMKSDITVCDFVPVCYFLYSCNSLSLLWQNLLGDVGEGGWTRWIFPFAWQDSKRETGNMAREG